MRAAAYFLRGRFAGRNTEATRPPRSLKTNRLVAEFTVVVIIEQTQLLLAVNRIKGVVDIQHKLLGRALEGIAVNLAPSMPHLDKAPRIGHVVHA